MKEMPKVTPTKTKEVKKLKHAQPLLGARFDPSGKFVFAGGQDNRIIRWEWQTDKKTEFIGHKSWVRPFAFSAKDGKLFSADYFGKILVWKVNAEKPVPLQTIEAHRGFIRGMVTSPDEKLIASCGNDRQIRLWSTSDGAMVRELSGHESHVYKVDFHPDGKRLASIDLMGGVKEWDLETGKVLRDMDAKILHKYDPTFRADIGGAKGVDFNDDGSLFVCGGITNVSNAFAGVGEPLFVLFDWKTGKQKKLLRPAKKFRGSAWGVKMHPEGYVIGVGAGGGGGALWFWKPEQEKSFHYLKLPTNARDLDLHTDSRHIVIPYADGHVRVYDMMPA